ncbi:MAG: AAA family ATPase [Planctomycetota bacterium]
MTKPDSAVAASIQQLLDALDQTLIGQKELHRYVVAGLLSRGHMLLEGMPGLGKTSLIAALGKLLGLRFDRVQFTPDLMPGDVLGTTILQERADRSRDFIFREGPVFTNILLADEINRASPKTQSALLEAMQERRVTVSGQTRDLPDPFVVLASQNPIELEGTYALPEAQLDRFCLKLFVRPPPADVLESIIADRRHGTPPEHESVTDGVSLAAIFAEVDKVVLPRAVSSYIARLTHATHADSPNAPPLVQRAVAHGASPRAAIAFAEVARGLAMVRGRATVGFEDIDELAPAVLRHRLILTHEARFDGITADAIVENLTAEIKHVPEGLPRGMNLVDTAEAARA